MNGSSWPMRTLEPLNLTVGLCAWDVSLLLADAAYVRAHPSLVTIGPDVAVDDVRRAGELLSDGPELRVLLGIHEPRFARRLGTQVRDRIDALGRADVELLVLWVDDPAELKAGGVLQTLFQLREQGTCHNLGLAHDDVRVIEWLARSTAVRALVFAYGLARQSARYRAVAAAEEFGMACIGLDPLGGDPAPPTDDAMKFALAESQQVLSVLSAPLPLDVAPMSAGQVERCWEAYRDTHPEPDPLPRGKPPS